MKSHYCQPQQFWQSWAAPSAGTYIVSSRAAGTVRSEFLCSLNVVEHNAAQAEYQEPGRTHHQPHRPVKVGRYY